MFTKAKDMALAELTKQKSAFSMLMKWFLIL